MNTGEIMDTTKDSRARRKVTLELVGRYVGWGIIFGLMLTGPVALIVVSAVILWSSAWR